MSIKGINYNGVNPYIETSNNTKTGATEGDFQKSVIKCTGTSTQKTALYSDALMSYASPKTGESVNI